MGSTAAYGGLQLGEQACQVQSLIVQYVWVLLGIVMYCQVYCQVYRQVL